MSGGTNGGGGASEPVPVAGSPGFDERLARLERLVVELEGGDLALEGAIERYRDGVRLLAECRELLGGYRRQVEELTRGAAEELSPWAGDPDADPS